MHKPLIPGLGQGEELQPPPWHAPGGISSAEAQSWRLLPRSFAAGQGFRLSPAAGGAKSCPVTSFPRPREQQEDLDLQSQSGHPCPAAANAPNLPEIPGDLLSGLRGTACVVPCAGGGARPEGCRVPPAIAHRYSAVVQWGYPTAPRAGGHGCRGIALHFSQLISINVKARTPPRPPARSLATVIEQY